MVARIINGCVYDTDVSTWVAAVGLEGEQASVLYEMPTGAFFLFHPARGIEPVTELEVRRFLAGAIDRQQIVEALDEMLATLPEGCPQPDAAARRKIIENVHRNALAAGVTKTGEVDLRRFLGGDDDR